MKRRHEKPLLAARWVKYALVPIEIAQRKLFKEIAREKQRAATED